jgi:hypothetical protein
MAAIKRLHPHGVSIGSARVRSFELARAFPWIAFRNLGPGQRTEAGAYYIRVPANRVRVRELVLHFVVVDGTGMHAGDCGGERATGLLWRNVLLPLFLSTGCGLAISLSPAKAKQAARPQHPCRAPALDRAVVRPRQAPASTSSLLLCGGSLGWERAIACRIGCGTAFTLGPHGVTWRVE